MVNGYKETLIFLRGGEEGTDIWGAEWFHVGEDAIGEDGVERLACLVWKLTEVGIGKVKIVVSGIVMEFDLSGFRIAKEFNWEREGVEWDEEEILVET